MKVDSSKIRITNLLHEMISAAVICLSFFAIEVFCFFNLMYQSPFYFGQLWPLIFGGVWSVMLTCLIRIIPRKAAKVLYGILYFVAAIYAGFQTGYYFLFSDMMWLSQFLYASEGVDYITVLLDFPIAWWLGIVAMILIGVVLLAKFPKWNVRFLWIRAAAAVLAVGCGVTAFYLPNVYFSKNNTSIYDSEYIRAKSLDAVYENMFNTHRLYKICGMYQTFWKDVYFHNIYPITPGALVENMEATHKIESYFAQRENPEGNENTGLFQGKNVVLVLMESIDDWMIGDHTPTIKKLMSEGINFTNFYTPLYGSVRTFNTEFCINTGSFLSSQGGYAFDYVTNEYNQSLASLLRQQGYSAKTFHYNDPSFYSRGVFSEAMGYEEYVYYADYLTEYSDKERTQLLYDDLILFSDPELRQEFYRDEEKTLNFIITRSAHLSYQYNEVLSHWALKKYPEYRGMTGNEETDCALVKARLVDDLFQWLLMTLEDEGKLQDTVIIGVTDHYTYGYKDEASLMELSGVGEKLLLEKTPCFIWSADLEPMEVDKTLNTADLLPTVLNLLGVESKYDYIGKDAFDDSYEGYALFSNGSWISGDVAYDAAGDKLLYLKEDVPAATDAFLQKMAQRVEEFVAVNNLILDSDYYQE